jgi:hypothetical protein
MQGVNNDAQVGTVCDNTSDKVPNSVEIVTDGDLTDKNPDNSSEQASYAPPQLQALCEAVGAVKKGEKLVKGKKKKRVISEAERERRRQSMLAILQRKRERKAQAAV